MDPLWTKVLLLTAVIFSAVVRCRQRRLEATIVTQREVIEQLKKQLDASSLGTPRYVQRFTQSTLVSHLRKEIKELRENPEALFREYLKRLIWRNPRLALVLHGGGRDFDCMYEEAVIKLQRRIKRVTKQPTRPRACKTALKTTAKYDQLVKAAVDTGHAYLIMDVADIK